MRGGKNPLALAALPGVKTGNGSSIPISPVCYKAPTLSLANATLASQRTGKLTEFAITQISCALSCSEHAFSMSLPRSSTTFGRRSTQQT
jgi:hypothetical protein